MDQKLTNNHDAQPEAPDAEDLSRRLYGGAVNVGVVCLRIQHSEGELTLKGRPASSSLQVDPLDLNTQSPETILMDPEVVVHRGAISRIRLVFRPATTGMSAALCISLSGVHFDNLLEEVKRREADEAGLLRRTHATDLAITGHLSVNSLGDVAFAEALAEDLFIFGWREEFGYESGAVRVEHQGSALEQPQGEKKISFQAEQSHLADFLKRTLDDRRAPVTPECPVCQKPMRRRRAYQGPNAGNDFWGCSGYPDCRGTRSLETAK